MSVMANYPPWLNYFAHRLCNLLAGFTGGAIIFTLIKGRLPSEGMLLGVMSGISLLYLISLGVWLVQKRRG